MVARKRPWLAFVQSLFVPGLGHFYLHEPSKGACLLGVCVLLGGGTWWFGNLHRLSLGLALLIVWVSSALDAYTTAQAFGQSQDWYFRRSYVIAMLLLVGPLALPLLWRSPYFSSGARWGWTGFVTAVVLLFFAIPYLLQWLIQRMPELQSAIQQVGIRP